MRRITFLAAIALVTLAVACCPTTYSGFGRYELRVGCDEVEIDGETYQVTRQGNDLVVDGHSFPRGIYRKTRPWLYLHGVEQGSDFERVDITFEAGGKELYPLYTGSTGSIFDVYAHPWEMKRSTCALFDDYTTWLVSHRWAPDGIYFDLQERLDGDNQRWRLLRPDIFAAADGTPVDVPEISTRVEIVSFDAAARSAMVRFTELP